MVRGGGGVEGELGDIRKKRNKKKGEPRLNRDSEIKRGQVREKEAFDETFGLLLAPLSADFLDVAP